jgi:hypothetical protein
MGEKRKVYKVLVGKPEGNRSLGRPRRRWEDGIRTDLRETGLRGVDWIRLAQDRDRWRAVVSTTSGTPATSVVQGHSKKKSKEKGIKIFASINTYM